MGIGMSFKVAPGIRIRATSRGLRTSIGPRSARIHVGAGRPTVSTGYGPVTLWTPLTGSSSPRRRSSSRPRGQAANLAAYQRQAAAAERAEQIAQVQQTENALQTLHRDTFPPAQRPVVPPPPAPDLAALTARHTTAALRGISVFARTRRREARAAAQSAAQSEANALWQQACAQQAAAQQQADAYWQALAEGDPATAHDALERAFEDNQWPATHVGHGTDDNGMFASVAMLFGTAEMVPERKPALTPGGKPTLHMRTKTERNDLYAAALGSTVLATVKEALAAAPCLSAIHLVVMRKDPQAGADKYLEVIYAARFPRAWTESLPWDTLDPSEALLRAPDAQLVRRGAARDIVGLDLSDEPGIGQVLELMRQAL